MTQQPTPYNDEISLVDLAVILVRRRHWFIAIFLLVVLGSIALAWLHKPSYQFKQQIELAHYYTEGSKHYTEGVDTAIAKINTIYLPNFIAQYNQQNPSKPLDVKKLGYTAESLLTLATNTGNAASSKIGLIIMGLKGKAKQRLLFTQINQFIFNALQNDEKKSLDSLRSATQAQIAVLAKEIPQLQTLSKMLTEYKLTQNNSSKSNGSLQALRDIYITSMGTGQHQNSIIDLQSKLSDKQARLASLQGVRLVPSLSQTVVVSKLNKQTMILLGLLLGLFLAVMGVFFVEFLGRVKERL